MVVFGLWAVLFTALVHAPETPEAQIRRLSVEAAAAYKAKDLGAYLGFFTSDFEHKKLSGQVLTRPDFDMQLAFQLAELQVEGMSSSLWRLTVRGEKAVSIVHSRMKAVAGNEQAEVKRLGRLTWTNTHSGWKVARSEVLAEKIRITGRTYRPEFFPYDDRPFPPAIAYPNNDARSFW